jgi:hypothetical protein
MSTRARLDVLRRGGLIVGMAAAITGGLHAQDAPMLQPLDRVAKWSGLAAENVARWRGTRQTARNWNKPDFDAKEWTRAMVVEGTTYPAEIIDEAGNRYPIPAQIQYAFSPFWLPPAPESRPASSALPVANRRADAAPVWFRQDFDFTEAYASCVTYVSQEIGTTLYVNGVKVGNGGGDGSHLQKGFKIDPFLHPGRNVLAIRAHQTLPIINPLTVRTDVHEAYPVRAAAPMAWRCSLSAGPNWSLPDYRHVPTEAWTPAVPVKFDPHFARKGEVASAPIWHTGDSTRQGVVYFRLPLDIAGLPNFGDCVIQADNGWELWVNGELAGMDKADHMHNPTPVTTVQIGRFLHPGKNIIGVKAYNYGGPGALSVLPHVKISF